MIDDPAFYAVAIPAVTLYGLSKGGFAGVSLMSMPLLSLVVPPVKAAAIILPVLMVQDAVTVWSYRTSFDVRTLLVTAPGGVLGIALGYVTASRVPDDAIRLLIGVSSVLFCLDAWLRPKLAAATSQHDLPKASLLGALSGYASFVIHSGGVPFNMYALPLNLEKRVFVGTGALFLGACNLLKLPPYLALGQITGENLALSAMLFPVAVAANLAGVHLVNRVSATSFYRLIYLLTFLVGIKLVLDAVSGAFGL